MRLAAIILPALCILSWGGSRRVQTVHSPSSPEEVAWRLFSEASAPCCNSSSPRWSQWIQDSKLFQGLAPELDNLRAKGRHPDIQNILIPLEILQEQPDLPRIQRDRLIQIVQTELTSPKDVVAHYNPDLEKAIRDLGLNTAKGQKKAFTQGSRIDLGLTTIAVKAAFDNIPTGMSHATFYIEPRSAQTKYELGLTAFHLTARILSKWIWATWEHTSVIQEHMADHGYCCSDSFGVDAKGQPSAALIELFKKHNVADYWKNYRLVGVQVYYNDSEGVPTRLGNYVLEHGSYTTSSCMTCHARAAYNSELLGLRPFQKDGSGYVGAPQPTWYRSGGQLTHLQTDFLWGPIGGLEAVQLLKQLGLINLLQ